ncbi:MAG: WecB/TagA/CpsF family glycosyltransferase [Candidatus Omnitrophica bacterium]|nr:WecB/TagA/CpsF family glycosyltransferase [Candidatus Omnitrophota bacterium]MDE2215314.1 WecB/TagA/CpsF family glycosyltransferase [Candidatus Omnitrophota bacterium]MDE2232141.1 WecB/TagA/CpsF family glycosyltransferase [Candidatus Omnitrophota bacterium]
MLKTICLLRVNVSRVNPVTAVKQICDWVREKQRTYVCVAPVSTLVDARRDSKYREVVNAAGMVTPDGMPVVWLARARGCKEVMRTYGPDLMLDVCNHGQDLDLRHFFYGGTEDTLRKLTQRLQKDYPQMLIAGTYAPSFRPKVWQEDQEVIDRINKAAPDIIWVGLGSPKQDFWMQINRPLLDAPVIVGAGAAFDFCSGAKPQAPRWMRSCGLEWFFRLCCEPGRLWKRYLVGNSLFLIYLIEDLLKRSP